VSRADRKVYAMRYPTFRTRVPARHPSLLEPHAMGMPWPGVPGHRPRGSAPEPGPSHWFMEGLPSPGDAGHPAHRRTGLVQHAYNPGVAAWRGKTVLACRVGSGPVSWIWIGYLRDDLSPRKDRFDEWLVFSGYNDERVVVSRIARAGLAGLMVKA
jgi:hypothetical protein